MAVAIRMPQDIRLPINDVNHDGRTDLTDWRIIQLYHGEHARLVSIPIVRGDGVTSQSGRKIIIEWYDNNDILIEMTWRTSGPAEALLPIDCGYIIMYGDGIVKSSWSWEI